VIGSQKSKVILTSLIQFVYSSNMYNKLLIFAVSFFAFLFVLVTSAFASTLYLSPAKTSVGSGSTVSVSVGLNTSGESINAVAAYLNYPTDKLEVVGLSYGGSFSIAAEGAYGGGSVRISRGSISGVVGSVTVATIRFKGKAQGAATVSFVGGSAAVRTSDSSDSLNLGGSTGAVLTVGAPKPGVTTSPQITGTKPTEPQDTTKPVISNLKVSEVSTNSAVITWQTDEKADSTVEYGLENNRYFIEVSNSELTENHSIKLESPALLAGGLFHFRAKSKDVSFNEVLSDDSGIRLKGYNVKIIVLDNKNKPIQNVDVLLYSSFLRSKTDVNGEAYFLDTPLGKQLIVVKLNNRFDKTQEIEVVESNTLQKFTLIVDSGYKNTFVTIIFYVLALIVVIAVAVVIKKKSGTQKTEEAPVLP